MAVDIWQWQMIRESCAKGSCLSAGYPDLLVPQDELSKAFEDGTGEIEERPDSQVLQAYHGFNKPVYNSYHVFAAMGLKLKVIDREKIEGSEVVMDLNEPQLFPLYDLVIDPGTLEHCFNIAQAAANLAGAVKVGGHITHAIPMAMFNHGYYNVNPVWFLDFYEANGFKVEKILIRHADGVYRDDMRARMKGVPDGAVTVMLAKRIEAMPITWPQQKK